MKSLTDLFESSYNMDDRKAFDALYSYVKSHANEITKETRVSYSQIYSLLSKVASNMN